MFNFANFAILFNSSRFAGGIQQQELGHY